MNVWRRRSRLAMYVTMAVIVSGCASSPPARAVKNVSEIAGKWEGAGGGPGGSSGVTQTIKPDGSYTTVIGPRTFTGKIQLVDGKLRGKSDQTGNAGTYSLHEQDGTRRLVYTSDDGRVGAELTPAK